MEDSIKVVVKETDKGVTMENSPDAPPIVAKDQTYAPLIGYFNVESNPDSKTDTMLAEIWQYLDGQAKNETTADRLMQLRSIETRLSPPAIGETRITQLWNYIKARKAVEKAEQWANSLLN